jgi:hypothetical protein
MELIHQDMISYEESERLNEEVKRLLASGMTGEDAIDAIISREGMIFIDQADPADTDGGSVQLYRFPDGRYTTVWFVSSFGDVYRTFDSPDEFDDAHVGFQSLGWSLCNTAGAVEHHRPRRVVSPAQAGGR